MSPSVGSTFFIAVLLEGFAEILMTGQAALLHLGELLDDGCHRSRSIESVPFTGFLVGDAVADVVDAPEGRDDLIVVGDDDDGGLSAFCHVPRFPASLFSVLVWWPRERARGQLPPSCAAHGGRL